MNESKTRGLSFGRPSRRDILKYGAGAGALAGLSMLAIPGARAQDGVVKILHSASVALPLWSVTYLAEDMGLYKGEGLNVERVGMNNGPAGMAALLAGEGASNFATPGEALAAKAQGQDLKTIMSLTNYSAYTLIIGKEFAAEHNVTSESSLDERKAALAAAKGARLGITVPGSLTDALTRIAVKTVGNNPETDASIVPLQSIANIIAAIANRGVDGFLGPSPATEQGMAELGAVALLKVEELPDAARLQGQVQIARGADLAEHPDLYAALVRAQLKAMKAIIDDPDAAGALLAKTRFDKLKPELWQTVWKNQLASFKSPYVTKDSLKAWIDTGLVGGNPDAATFPFDEVLAMQFVDDGLKAIGWTPKA
jgi:ABC-type nitrate/sulfonate/bicarbonate transport system substrate-binding protein